MVCSFVISSDAQAINIQYMCGSQILTQCSKTNDDGCMFAVCTGRPSHHAWAERYPGRLAQPYSA